MKLCAQTTDQLNGRVTIPGSKSQSVRALLFALASNGVTRLSNVVDAKDTEAAISVVESFGAEVTITAKDQASNGWRLIVESEGPPFNMKGTVNSGNSGITTRFMMPLAGMTKGDQPVWWDAGDQMKGRPIGPLVEALRALGLEIQSQWPLEIEGDLDCADVEIDGKTSQYLSALLMTLSLAPCDSTIRVQNLQERPYVEMSLAWLDEQGILYDHEREGDWDIFHMQGGQKYNAFEKHIPGDWSSASYPMAAGVLLPGEVRLYGLDTRDQQGDRALLEILQSMGANIQVKADHILIQDTDKLQGMTIDCGAIPDMLPTLAVVATQAEGETRLINCAHARIKETDRIHSMHEGLSRMGADIEMHNDGLTIRKSKLRGAEVNGYDDHRSIMALALAGLLAEGETKIMEAEGLSKTFPNFVKLMRSLGARMHMHPLVLMGFKHTGKSSVGRALAQLTGQEFRDLDDVMMDYYERKYGERKSCRQIMKDHGEADFREFETRMLKEQVEDFSGVLALGGGAALEKANQPLLTLPTCIHMTSPKEKVFEWISKKGKPANYGDGDFYQEFSRRWDRAEPIYAALSDFTIESNRPAAESAKAILEKL